MVSLAALVGGEEGEEHEEVVQHGRAVAGGQHLREAVGAAAVAASKRGHQAGSTSRRCGCRGRGPRGPRRAVRETGAGDARGHWPGRAAREAGEETARSARHRRVAAPPSCARACNDHRCGITVKM